MAESKNLDSGLISRLQLIQCIHTAMNPNPNLSHKTHNINIVYIKRMTTDEIVIKTRHYP